jgi:preprotein translocase subunit SecG
VSIAYGKSIFTIIYAAIFAGLVLLLYMLKKEKLNDWVIDILGVSSAAYAIYDTFVDTILLQINHKLNLIAGWGGEQPVTDAVIIERMTHVPAVVWGMLWLIIACVAVYTTISGKKRTAASSRTKKKSM